MSSNKYKGLSASGSIVRWIDDIIPGDAVELWKQDARVVKITENGKQIWKRK